MRWLLWFMKMLHKPRERRPAWFNAGYISEEMAARAMRRGMRYLRSHAGASPKTAPRHIHEKLVLANKELG